MFANEVGQLCELEGWEEQSVVADGGGAGKGKGSPDSAGACEPKMRKLWDSYDAPEGPSELRYGVRHYSLGTGCRTSCALFAALKPVASVVFVFV